VKLIIAPGAHLFPVSAVSSDMEGALAIGLNAIALGFDKISRDTSRAAQAFSPNSADDGVSAMVDLRRDALEVRAGAAIVRTGAELSQYILDIVA
jgi:hypothetical protein